MRFSRAWAMPSADTFSVAPILAFAREHLSGRSVVLDPFARNCKLGTLRNDLDPSTSAENHQDAVEWLSSLPEMSADAIVFDPPYSPRQIAEVYSSIGRKCTTQDTQDAAFKKRVRRAIHRVLKVGGCVVQAGWNTVSPGPEYALIAMLDVCHGSGHNDTLVTAWEKIAHQEIIPLHDTMRMPE